MRNLYDDQAFWVERVKRAKSLNDPTLCLYGNLNPVIQNRVEIINKFIPKEQSILDAGCGYGWLSQYIENSYTGVDQTVALINYGKELYPNVSLVLSKLQNLPFDDNSFDWIVSSCVKEGIVEGENINLIEKGRWDKIQNELLRVAKQGIIWPNYSNEYEIIKR